MAAEGQEQRYFDDFSLGLDSSEDERNVDDKSSPDCANIRFHGRTYYTRPGYESYLDKLSGTGFLGLDSWIKNDSLISAHNGVVYRGDASANSWTSTVTGLGTSAEMGFLEYLGDIYYGNGVDATGRIQHTSYTASTPAGMPKGNIFTSWAEKMWIAGDPDNERTLSYGRTASAANPEYIYDFAGAGSGTELLGKRGKLTGLSVTKNALIILKDKETYFVKTFDSTTLAPNVGLLSGNVGAVGRKAYTKVGDEIYFFTGAEVRVIAEYQGFPNLYTAPISDLVRRLFRETLDKDQTGSVMAFDEENNLLKLWVKRTGSTNNDLCFVYHFDEANKTWTVDTGKPASQATKWNKRVYWTSAVIGQCWLDEEGNTDGIGYIDVYRWTAKRRLYAAIGRKKFRMVNLAGSLDVESETEFKAEIWIDGTLHKTVTIDSDDIIGGIQSGLGAVGTFPVGQQPVGGTNAPRRNFEKIIKLNKIGRYIQIKYFSQTLGGFFQVTDELYRYLPMARSAERNY